MAKKRIVILGAGMAGLSVAWHLEQKGFDCLVLEKEPEAGGLCRSKKIGGFTFDYSGHLLHFKHDYSLRLVRSLLQNNLAGHTRSAWIYSHQRFTRYPFQANLYGLPHPVMKECLLEYITRQNGRAGKGRGDAPFLDWINHTFGKGIARHFMVPYNTKFWTVPPARLTCEWLDGFIPVPSLRQIIEGTLDESRRQLGYNARFWYPREGGVHRLPAALAGRIRHVRTNCGVRGIDIVKKQITLGSGAREGYDILVSTIPLPEIPRLAPGLPVRIASLFKLLRWNSIFNLNLGVRRHDADGRHWIYVPQRDISFFRVGFYHNFSGHLVPKGAHSLYAEVAYAHGKPIDKKTIVARITKDLKKIGILTPGDDIVASDVNDIQYGYPIYDRNCRAARTGITAFLNKHGIVCAGRYGSWRYMSIEDVLLEGRSLTEALANTQ